MKKAALILMGIALLLTGIVVWGFSQTTLHVTPLDVVVMPAAQQLSEFDRQTSLLSSQAVRGTVFEQEVTGNPNDYCIMQYTLSVRNRGLIAARMLEVQVMPIKGDVLCYSQQEAQGRDVNEPLVVKAGEEATIRCYLLTRQGIHAVRDLYVTYYIWGHPLTVKVTYG